MERRRCHRRPRRDAAPRHAPRRTHSRRQRSRRRRPDRRGRQGQSNLGNAVKQPDTAVGAVCDVYEPNLAKGLEVAPGAKSYRDFRRVLDDKDIDAVIIATPDHWHADPCRRRLRGGQGRLRREADRRDRHRRPRDGGRRAPVRAASCRSGTQQRSGKHFQQAVELVKAGRIGKVTSGAHLELRQRVPAGSATRPTPTPPKGLDWDLWLGPAPRRPFNANRFGVSRPLVAASAGSGTTPAG